MDDTQFLDSLDSVPKLDRGRLVIALSGWMDGGEVSTGALETLITAFEAVPVAEIDPCDYFIYNFPGSMEVTALFRPHVEVEDGLITSFSDPAGIFYAAEEQRLLLFISREPNLRWPHYADTILEVIEHANVETVYFIGSVGGAVPHTRSPRLRCSCSTESIRDALHALGVSFTDYTGPAGFSTYMLQRAADEDLEMASIVAETPAYVEGRNPRSIEAVLKLLVPLLGLKYDFSELLAEGDRWEQTVNEAMAEQTELADQVKQLEADYDNQIFDTQMDDLKDLLSRKGIRMD